MIINIVKIRWDLVQEAVPAFLTMIVMPLTYSVAYGAFLTCGYLVLGSASWPAAQLLCSACVHACLS
jgi:xanthine/uracil/vitamin C permease (AzgA family)